MRDTKNAEGYVVSGRYRLLKRLGEGGMGAVWLADHVTLRSKVAIKLLHPSLLDTDDGMKRFLREAQAAALLRSPHVVQILDHGVDGGIPYIAMELLEGESLAARLARVSKLTLPQTARLVTHVARAIGKAHDAGIVHRDLKPDNVFIVHNDDEEVAKVLDFGIAKMVHPVAEPAGTASTREGSILGTPLYMSPEQVRGYGVDWRSDLWSLAIIAFECVCGRAPFAGRTIGDLLVLICSEPLPVPSSLAPLPAAFDAWFAKAASRDVEARFQSAKEMAEALRTVAMEAVPPSSGSGLEREEPGATSFGAAPARPDASGLRLQRAVGAETTDPQGVDPATETDRIGPDTGRLDPDPTADTAQIEPPAESAEPDRARTLDNVVTTGDSAAPPSIPSPPRPRPARRASFAAGAVVAATIGLAAWLALAGRGSTVTGGSASERPRPPAPSAMGPEPPHGPATAPTAPPEPSTAASLSPSASAMPARAPVTMGGDPPYPPAQPVTMGGDPPYPPAQPERAASSSRAGAPDAPASARASNARGKAPAPASSQTKPHASDELTF